MGSGEKDSCCKRTLMEKGIGRGEEMEIKKKMAF
jgi:hypothetical protein